MQHADNDWLNRTELVQLLEFKNPRKKVSGQRTGAMLKVMKRLSIHRVGVSRR